MNSDLWRQLDEEVSRHKTTWTWTKGHAAHDDNNRADELAAMAAREQRASG
jgi:ribonuclease HI